MQIIRIKPSSVSGVTTTPPSKSQSLRAIVFASLASGQSTVKRFLPSPDIFAMIRACEQLGAVILQENDQLLITGFAGRPSPPDDIIDSGNSGQVLRFVTAIAALLDNYVVITGDHSIRHNRPMQPLIDGLSQLGAFCVSTKEDGFAPIIVKGPIRAGQATVDGVVAQPISGLLMAAAVLSGRTELTVTDPKETAWVALTLDWMRRLNIKHGHEHFHRYWVEGGPIESFQYTVPGDFSTLAYPVAGALISRSKVIIDNVMMQDSQGDKALLGVLEQMGARFSYDDEHARLVVDGDVALQGIEVDINEFVDSINILAVIACYARGRTVIRGAAVARSKECDRLAAMCSELTKMGASIAEFDDGLIIEGGPLRGATVFSHHDHRVVLSLSVAALGAVGETIIEESACVAKTYAHFVSDFQNLGADIIEQKIAK